MNEFSPCPHFLRCSGCVLRENFFHPPIREEITAFFVSQGVPISFHEEGFSKTRWKAKLPIRGTAEAPLIGLFQKGTHEVEPIPHCLVHHPKINESISLVLETIRSEKIPPYNEQTRLGTLRYVQAFVERKTGRVQLAFAVNTSAMDETLRRFLNTLLEKALWHSIWINFNLVSTNTIFSDQWVHYAGEKWLWQTFHSTSCAIHPGAFSQVHLPLFEKALQTIRSWVTPDSSCLELFAGVGVISLFIQDKCRKIELIENNPFSALSFQESVNNLSTQHLFYHLQSVTPSLLPSHNLIIVDPPRKGLGALLTESLIQYPAEQLIYMSCQFESFRKDAKQLIAGGWRLLRGEGYFLFPGTNEIEVLALFERR